jgi:hypothetical protein
MPLSIPSGGTGANFIASALYAGRIEIIRARVLVGVDDGPIATEYLVDRRFNGQFFQNARFKRLGFLPPGISFLPDSTGIRFYGVPQASGTYEALFEGPYPDNFVGTSTDGNAQVVCQATPQTPNVGIQTGQVFSWLVRFVVTTVNAFAVPFGVAYSYMLSSNSATHTAKRESWGSSNGSSTFATGVPSAPVVRNVTIS